MKVAIIAASLLAAAQSVFAHTYLDHIVLPGGANGDCVRHTSQWTTGQRNYPIKDLTSENMICGFAPTQPAAQRCPITAGSKLGLIFGHDRPGDDIIAASHWGACNIYLAAQPANGGVPTGADWFKIQEEGYPNGKWCTSRLIETKGLLDVTLPSNLPSGKYLLRAEIGALHEADTLFTQNPARGLQLYVYCAELTVTGSGNANFSPKVDFPGAITYQSPGVLFNVYAPFNSYPTFGPAI
ncbi:family 61 glycosyl hydrolase, partial [Fimicolochytrium jonesii]|uniref:family 61 glycosyl hydrolase n=1 Tax=Fimicolochytrium jonesii TaxID=1396493 RepID=UPI0022FDDF8F